MATYPQDSFRVHARMGSGTTGAVFRATRQPDGRPVVLKALHGDFAAVMDLDHLQAVCTAIGALQHHAIPAGTELMEWRGDQVVTRDYIQGVDLATVVAGSAPPLRVALHIASELAGALAAVKAATGFSHGDVKPSNVFIDMAGDIQVVDFGMARPHPERTDRTLTLFHASVGFMPPERVDNERAERSDEYSVGLILAWMITGEMPRRTSANPSRHAEQRLQLLTRVEACGASRAVARVVEATTEYRPEDRLPMAELARKLAQLSATTSGPALQTWAGPLIEALLVQPNEVEVTDVGQSLSIANSVPHAPTPGASRPVSRIRTGAHTLPPQAALTRERPPVVFAIGVGMLLIAVAMLAGAISIAAQG